MWYEISLWCFDLIVYFGYSVNKKTSNMRICYFNKTKLNQLLLLIDVGFVGRIHLVCCNFAVFRCRLFQNFIFVEEVDITLFAKLIHVLEITSVVYHYRLSESPNWLVIDSKIENHDLCMITFDLESDCHFNRATKSNDTSLCTFMVSFRLK